MKKILKSLFMIMLICPLIVKATSVSLDCPSATKYGAEITCKIKISPTETVAGFQANITASSGLSYKSYTKTSGWDGTSSDKQFIVYGKKISESATLGTYTYKVTTKDTGNLTVTLSSILVSNTEGGKISTNTTASDTIRIMESDDTLKSLTINGESVANFSSSTLNYTYKTEASSIKITATANSSKATITGTGTKTVKYGTNTYNIVVKAENGSTKTYKITVTRPDNRETINTLESLSVDGYTITPTFNKNTKEYSLTVENNVEKVKINATKTSNKSTFVSGYGPREQKLNYGENKVYIKVKAENEKENVYTIIIKRKDNRSSNNNLKTLSSTIGNIKFDKNTTTYSVLTDQDSITISAETEDTKATISGTGTIKLKDGLNEIKLVVKAENEKEKTYTIKVTKVDDFSSLNISNNLEKLDILKKYPFEFNKDETEYTITIREETSLEINYETEDDNSYVEITGNENLKDGSVIVVKVISIDGKEKEYKINIKKEENTSTTEKNSKLPIILLIVSAILNIVLVILFSKKNKYKEVTKEQETEKSKEEIIETPKEETAEENQSEELQEIPEEVIVEEEKKDNE